MIKLTHEDYAVHCNAWLNHKGNSDIAADVLAARLESRLIGPLEATDRMVMAWQDCCRSGEELIKNQLTAALAAAPWRDAAKELADKDAEIERLKAKANTLPLAIIMSGRKALIE